MTMHVRGVRRARLPLACTTALACAFGILGPAFAQLMPPAAPPPQSATPGALPPEWTPTGRLAAPGVPQVLRWTEDWSQPEAGSTPLASLRHISLGREDTYLSIGGEARFYYMDTNHLTLGTRPGGDANSTFMQRLRLMADLHVGPHFRAFVELGDNREYGEEIATPPNEDKFDLEQAFVDLTLPLGSGSTLNLRPGRFEMPLGSGKLVGLREGPNSRFLFQGVRATYTLPGAVRVDAFLTKPVEVKSERSFDDGTIDGGRLNGVHISTLPGALVPGLALDGYYYNVKRRAAPFVGRRVDEERESVGVRAYGRRGAWDYDAEAVYQFGQSGSDRIRAWGLLMEAGYSMPHLPLTPRLGLRVNAFSGDGTPGNGTNGTFVAPFPKAPVYTNSDAAWFNFSNMVDVFPMLSLKPARTVTIVTGPEVFWRQTANDVTYAGPTSAPLIRPVGKDRYVGTAYNFDVNWQPATYVAFRLTYNRFFASEAFKAGGGESAHFLGLQTQLKF